MSAQAFLPVDLHCHSVFSDGVLTPAELAERAHANGVRLWALTDHDEVSGLSQARAHAQDRGMVFVDGVEISVTWAGHTVHVVGLGINPAHPGLRASLHAMRVGRQARARAIGDRLADLGFAHAYDGALPFAANPELVSRTHFARFLVQQGHCADLGEAFRRYLGDGKPAFVPTRWASLTQAVEWIRQAGGKAIIAHPGRYDLDDTRSHALFSQFQDLGGVGIEVLTGSHTAQEYAIYAQVARRYGFQVSCGSDFHGPSEGRIDLGGLPPLPAGLVPVWQEWL
ncbi:MAG TPA: PHP domain-containing protein [Alcaligenes sp.]|nr:PHP domain-containing protein [Alcaligenes sp.]HRL28206.1 PHP domain-containing protein [Alcaligenes sp.]